MKFQIIATNSRDEKTVINESDDVQYLDRIVEARDGMTWVRNEACSLQVIRVK